MKMEDYNEYYIQGSDHYLIPKDVFKELFNEMVNWREEANELKKQLEELKEEKQEWINLLAMFKNQQKEFIKWLEDYLKLFDNMCIDEQGYYDMLEEILQKYKSIIGENDE